MVMLADDPAFILWVEDKEQRWTSIQQQQHRRKYQQQQQRQQKIDNMVASTSLSRYHHHHSHYPSRHEQQQQQQQQQSRDVPNDSTIERDHPRRHHGHSVEEDHRGSCCKDDGLPTVGHLNNDMYWTCLACRTTQKNQHNHLDDREKGNDDERCNHCHAIKGSRLRLRR